MLVPIGLQGIGFHLGCMPVAPVCPANEPAHEHEASNKKGYGAEYVPILQGSFRETYG